MSEGGNAGAPDLLVLTGTVGSGKSTTAVAIGQVLAELGTPHALIDLDGLGRAWPPPAEDRFHRRLTMENLERMAASYRRAGAQRLIVAGVVEDSRGRVMIESAAGGPVIVCRLRVGLDRVRKRLIARHGPGPDRDWHLARSGELERIVELNAVEDLVVDVDDEEPDRIAREILRRIHWDTGAAG